MALSEKERTKRKDKDATQKTNFSDSKCDRSAGVAEYLAGVARRPFAVIFTIACSDRVSLFTPFTLP